MHEFAHFCVRIIGYNRTKWPEYGKRTATPPIFTGKEKDVIEAGNWFQERVFGGRLFPYFQIDTGEFKGLVALLGGMKHIVPPEWASKILGDEQLSKDDIYFSSQDKLWDIFFKIQESVTSDHFFLPQIRQELKEPGFYFEEEEKIEIEPISKKEDRYEPDPFPNCYD